MATVQRVNWGSVFKEAVAAGIAGAILIELYLVLTTVLPQHGSIMGMLQWTASTVIGKVAFTGAAYAWLGLLIHFCVSIAWAGGYAYLASQQKFMNHRWAISGLVYGLVVYGFMQLILLGDNNLKPPPTPNDFINALIAHAVFFGLPVAFVVSRFNRTFSR